MPIELIHLLGAGGHGRVVLDALLSCGRNVEEICVRDDRLDLQGISFLGCKVEWPIVLPSSARGWVHASVGSGALRKSLLSQSGFERERWLTVIHPHASVSPFAQIEPASFIAAQSVVGPCVKIGCGSIVNHGAVIDHDCQVGEFSHVAPHASLGGNVTLGSGVLIGAGARILPGLTIEDDAVIGAGSVVLTNVARGQTWFGVPARQRKKEFV